MVSKKHASRTTRAPHPTNRGLGVHLIDDPNRTHSGDNKANKVVRRKLGNALLAYDCGEAYYQTSVGPIWVSELPPRESSQEERVRCVMQLMRDLRFADSEMPEVLEHAWHYHLTTVRNIISEAHRRVRAEVCDPEVVSRNIGVVLFEAIRAARAHERWELVARLAKTWADIVGATAAHQVRVQVDPTSGMSDTELAELTAEAIGYLERGETGNDAGSSGSGSGADSGANEDE